MHQGWTVALAALQALLLDVTSPAVGEQHVASLPEHMRKAADLRENMEDVGVRYVGRISVVLIDTQRTGAFACRVEDIAWKTGQV